MIRPRTSLHLPAPLATQPCASAGTRATPWCSLPLHEPQLPCCKALHAKETWFCRQHKRPSPGSSSASHEKSWLSTILPQQWLPLWSHFLSCCDCNSIQALQGRTAHNGRPSDRCRPPAKSCNGAAPDLLGIPPLQHIQQI